MEDKKKKNIGKKIAAVSLGAILSMAGAVVVPKLMSKYQSKLYKMWLKKENHKN